MKFKMFTCSNQAFSLEMLVSFLSYAFYFLLIADEAYPFLKIKYDVCNLNNLAFISFFISKSNMFYFDRPCIY